MTAIRAFEAADTEAVAAILLPIFHAGETYAIDPDIDAAGALAYWTGAGHDVFVAEVNGRVVGTHFIVANNQGGGAHVCNCGFATAPEAQGQGIARAMLDHSLAEATRQSYEAMQFNFVVETNTRAIETWEKNGFAEVGRLPGAFHHPTQGKVAALVMYRKIEDH